MVKMHRHTFTLKYNFTKFVLKEVFWLWEFTFTQSNILFEGTVDSTQLDETCMLDQTVCGFNTVCFIQLQYGKTIITDTCVFKVSIQRGRERKQRENRRIYLQAQESLEEKKFPACFFLCLCMCVVFGSDCDGNHKPHSITNYHYLHLNICYEC